MAKVGTIAIDLVAFTGKLNAPLAKATTHIKGFVAGVEGTRARLGTMIAGLGALTGGILTVGAAIGRVKGQFEEVDTLAKSADRLGLTTEAFVGLQHGADLAGVGVEQLTTAMQKMLANKSLDLPELKAGDTMGALEVVADNIAGMATDAERLQYAVSVFGRGGAQMVDFLRDGAAGMKDAADDAQKLGLTLTRVDAAKIEMANDAVTRLQGLITGVARKIAIELAPFIKFAADSFVNWGTEGEGAGGKVRAAVDLVIDGLAFGLDVIDATRTAWAGLQVGAQQALSFIVTGVGYLVKAVEVATEGIVFGFTWAWTRATQFVQEAVAKMISLLANVANWIETQLPERFRLGIGSAAQAFSEQFNGVVEQNRQAMEANPFKVDFKFGDNAMALADTMADDVNRAAKEFEEFANREKMSDKLRRNVEKIREDAQKAAEEAVLQPPTAEDVKAPGFDRVTAGALERGSSEAFSAFQKNRSNQKSADERLLEETKRHTDKLSRIEKNTRSSLQVAPI